MIGLSLLFKFAFCNATDACLLFKNAVTFLAQQRAAKNVTFDLKDRQQLFHDVLLYLTRRCWHFFVSALSHFFRTSVLSFFVCLTHTNAFINAIDRSCINCQAQNNIHRKLYYPCFHLSHSCLTLFFL